MRSLVFPLLAVLSTAAPTPEKRGSATSCGKPVPSDLPPLGTGSYKFHIESSGGDREYLLFAPATYDINKPTALIFSFHGHSKTAEEEEGLSQLSNPEFNKDAIVVYPQGIADQWQGDPSAPSNISDIQFTSDMIDHLMERYCVDPNRIYANGKSNGGGFTGELACSSQLSSKFAAFAACSGAFYEDTPTDVPCNPGRSTIPFLEFHGTADTTIPYSGGPRRGATLPTIPDYLASWATRNGCPQGQQNTTTYEYQNNVQISSWSCNGNQDIVQGYLINGMAHDWPSTVPNDDNKTGHTYLNATPIIVEFFNKHVLNPVSVESVSSSSALSSALSTASTPSSTSSGASNPASSSAASLTSSSVPSSSNNSASSTTSNSAANSYPASSSPSMLSAIPSSTTSSTPSAAYPAQPANSCD